VFAFVFSWYSWDPWFEKSHSGDCYTVTDISVGFISIYTIVNSLFYFLPVRSLWSFINSLWLKQVSVVFTLCAACILLKLRIGKLRTSVGRPEHKREHSVVLCLWWWRENSCVAACESVVTKTVESCFLLVSLMFTLKKFQCHSNCFKASSWRNSFNTVTRISANVIKYAYITERSEPSRHQPSRPSNRQEYKINYRVVIFVVFVIITLRYWSCHYSLSSYSSFIWCSIIDVFVKNVEGRYRCLI
jgi:hypothetical protein